jgi:uncharacterized protein YjbI with pentapeptide repeats
MRDCYLKDTDLSGAKMEDAEIKGAMLLRTNLTGSTLQLYQLRQARSPEEIILPDGQKQP